jgi:glycosyltransferase involved in cell wall biosynthesis
MFIIPHFKMFIEDQIRLIKPSFREICLLMPLPRLSGFIYMMPYFNMHFRHIGLSLATQADQRYGNNLFICKYTTLPIEVLRKRNCFLAAASALNCLKSKKINADLFHAHFIDIDGFVGAQLKEVYNKPLIVNASGSDAYDLPFRNDWYKACSLYVLSAADRVIAVSQYIAKKISELGVSKEKIRLIPNGYNKIFRPFSQTIAREKLGLPQGKKILLCVGSLTEGKGHIYLLEAMKLIRKSRNDVTLLIIGSGDLETALRKRILQEGLDDSVFLVGEKVHGEIPLWMNACDVFVLPSLGESFGVVLIEALACGKPVVATHIGGIPEIISNDDVGVLVQPADPLALFEGLVVALSRKWLSERILDFASKYSLEKTIPSLLNVYLEILNSPN